MNDENGDCHSVHDLGVMYASSTEYTHNPDSIDSSELIRVSTGEIDKHRSVMNALRSIKAPSYSR